MQQKKLVIYFSLLTLIVMVFFGCQKKERPKLGDFPEDANAPGGPLKFYVAFDGTTADPLRNAVDSVRANFAADNPLESIDGISGKALKGDPGKNKAVRYSTANDWVGNSTSFTVSYWLKNTPQTDGEPEFHFSLPTKDYWHGSALFLLVEKGGNEPGNSTRDSMACTFAVKDNWVEYRGVNRLPKVLDGNWHHLVFTYNETNSKVTAYVDGVATNYNGPANTIGGSTPMGPCRFYNAARDNISSFVVGGWNKHTGGLADPFKGPQDPWIHSYSGGMDQFRLYGTALTASEVLALYNSRR
jgi:hypothetical protein